jgi:class 3 adenylate cyclase/tetratricopeptide (TPR) repeat protein
MMFVDMVGSTPLAEALGAEEFRALVRKFHRRVKAAVENWSGKVVQIAGDGALCYFGYPTARDDHARFAIESAIEIRDGLTEWSDLNVHGATGHVQIRIACHSGNLIVETPNASGTHGPAEGADIALAARLQGVAEPNGIVVSEDCLKLADGYFEVHPLGTRHLRGIAHPVRAFSIIRRKEAITRFHATHSSSLVPLVGRKQELGVLRLERERSRGAEGRCMTILGEAGVGKSRLLEEFRLELEAAGAPSVVLQCEEMLRDTSFGPFVSLLSRLLHGRFAEQALAPERPQLRPILNDYLSERKFDAAYGDTLEVFLSPEPAGSEDPTSRAKKFKRFIREFLIRQATGELVIFIEDAHWADPSTLEALSEFLHAGLPSGHLVLVTSRTVEPIPSSLLRSSSILRLAPLSSEESLEMLRLLSGGSIDLPTAERIAELSDGIPLFLEESFRDQGKSNEARADRLSVPERLQGLIWRRLDELNDRKWIAQLASIFGTAFDLNHLVHAAQLITGRAEAERSVRDSIDVLRAAELLTTQDSSAENRLRFRHALIRQAAYDSLPSSQRREWHRAAADAIEQASEISSFLQPPEVVARHRSIAGERAEAARLYSDAGQNAISRNANAEAVRLLDASIIEAQGVPIPHSVELELRARRLRNVALLAQTGWASHELEMNTRSLLQVARAHGSISDTFNAQRMLFNVALLRAEALSAASSLEGMKELAERLPANGDETIIDRCEAAFAFFLLGDLDRAEMLFSRALANFDRARHGVGSGTFDLDGEVAIRSVDAWVTWFQGKPQLAREKAFASIQLARELNHTFSLAYALCLAGSVFVSIGDPAALEIGSEAKALSERYRMDYWSAYAEVLVGGALLDKAPEMAVQQLDRARSRYIGTGAQLIVVWIFYLQAQGYRALNENTLVASCLTNAVKAPASVFHKLISESQNPTEPPKKGFIASSRST